MSIPLNVLVIEDSEDDTLLIMEELRQAGYDPAFVRVDSPDDMRASLSECTWDIIIADHSMPRFDASSALDLLQNTCLDVPFILVSGTVSTEVAVDMMRRGAKDFILKNDMSRLAPAVSRELREAEVRRQRTQAEEALRSSEARLAEAQRLAHMGSYEFALPDGKTTWSDETYHIFDMDPSERAPTPSEHISLVHPDDQQDVSDTLRKSILDKSKFDLQYRIFSRDGSIKWVHSIGEPVTDEAGAPVSFFGTIMDITERKVAEQREQEFQSHAREFYKRTISAATNGKLIVSDLDEIWDMAGQPLREWHFSEADDLGVIRHGIAEIAEANGMNEFGLQRMMTCIGEAGANALKHAGGGIASVHRAQDSLVCIIEDHGSGIETLNLPAVALIPGYTTTGTMGMGYKLMIASANKVYLSTGPEGTTVACEVGLNEKDEETVSMELRDMWAR